jgi:polar amino acid transport system substrate-binding protein
MPMFRTLRLLPLALIVLVIFAVAAVAGCGGDDETTTTTAAAETTTTMAPETTTTEMATLYDELPDAIKQAGVLKFVGDSHPPYRVVADDGSISGIDPDMQAALSEVLGIPTEMEISEGLPAMLSGMLSGRYDAFNGPVRDTAEREEDFDAIVWMTTVTSYLFPKERTDITESADLSGMKVAGTTGSVVEAQLEKLNAWFTEQGMAPAEFVGLADTNSTVLAVQSGRADAAAMTETAALDFMSKEGETWNYVRQTEEQGAGIDKLALFVPKSGGLGPVMLKAFEMIFENGEYMRIMEEYGIEAVALEAPEYNTAAQ